MEYFLFFVGFLLVVAVIFLTAEVRRLSSQLKREQAGTERSFAAIELAFEEMMEQIESRGKELLGQLEAAGARAAPEAAAAAPDATVDDVGDGGPAAGVAGTVVEAPAPEAQVREAPAPQPPVQEAPVQQTQAQEAMALRTAVSGAAHPIPPLVRPEPTADAGPAELPELPETARRARALVDSGLSTVDVARTLGIGRGEVQLLLSLDRSRLAAEAARRSRS